MIAPKVIIVSDVSNVQLHTCINCAPRASDILIPLSMLILEHTLYQNIESELFGKMNNEACPSDGMILQGWVYEYLACQDVY
jgi:hypothetical protein